MGTFLTAMLIFSAGLIAGRMLDHARAPSGLRAWWDGLDAKPAIPRRAFYVLQALALAFMAGGTALIVGTTAARNEAIEARLRQCEQRHQAPQWDQQQPAQANPSGHASAAVTADHAQVVAKQAGAEQGNQQVQQHAANFMLADAANDATQHGHHDVTRQCLGTHRNPPPVVGASIAQGGVA